MKNINIFVAGAKDLKESRMMLKALANDMNAEYDAGHKEVHITILSYENFVDNNQAVYDSYIVNDTDIVIFVLNGRIGDKTEKEFMLATENNRSVNRPKTFVFLKSYDSVTPEIAYINGLMRNMSKDYYYNYENDHDLLRQAKDVIKSAVDGILDSGVVSSTTHQGRAKMSRAIKYQRGVIATLLVAICALSYLLIAGGINSTEDASNVETRGGVANTDSPLLVAIGGGSVANYIKDSLNIVVDDYENMIYMHMPSMATPPILGEELVIPSKRYMTVCLSASEVSQEDFYKTSKIQPLYKGGCVLGVRLGVDPLNVMVRNCPITRKYIDSVDMANGRISVKALGAILKNDEQFTIYTTSYSSGTRNEYVKALARRNIALKSYEVFAVDKGVTSKDGVSPIVILGSKFYTSKTFQYSANADVRILHLYDTIDDVQVPINKQMYVYFLGYGLHHDHVPESQKQYMSESEVYVPQATVDFLLNLKVDIRDVLDEHNTISLHNDTKFEYIEDIRKNMKNRK